MKPNLYEQLYGIRQRKIYGGMLALLLLIGTLAWRHWTMAPASVRRADRPSRPSSVLTAATPTTTPPTIPPVTKPTGGSDLSESRAAVMDPSYRVRLGNCLWRIAESRCGTGFGWPAIYRANRGSIADPDLIYPGQQLAISCGK